MYQEPYASSPDAVPKPYTFVRLPMMIDPGPIVAEIRGAGIEWLSSQWKWHLRTMFCIARGGPDRGYPGSRLVSGGGVDAPELDRLPRLRQLLDTAFPAPAAVGWVAVSPPDARIFLHIDNTPHWDRHHRLHVALETNASARLCIDGRFVHMPEGSVWALNNSLPHGAENLGPPRMHLVIDLPSTPEVEAFFAAGQRVEGDLDPAAFARLSRDPMEIVTEEERGNSYLMARFASQ
jgi:kumamolisin